MGSNLAELVLGKLVSIGARKRANRKTDEERGRKRKKADGLDSKRKRRHWH